jgi:glycosyltransferase involved in cell wall biosynthesis
LKYKGKVVSLGRRKGTSIISSSLQHANIGEELDSRELKALLHWNIANRKRRSADSVSRPSLSGYLNYQKGRWAHRLMRLDPQCQGALAVLWRQLGMEAVEALFARPLLTLDRAALAEITGSAFWRNVLLPLDKPGGLPAFFDTPFYLGHRGLDLQGLTPVAHYVLVGVGEGRNPHPLFNTAWYLSRNPDVVASGTNPLLHFVMAGGPEGRRPHPAVRGSWYRLTYEGRHQAEVVPAPKPVPIAERRYVIREVASAPASVIKPASKRPIICVSHVLPSQPRAGNEYRISRLLEWLAGRGHDLMLVVAPEEAEEPDAAKQKIFFEKYPNAVVCCRDGTVFVSAGALSRSVALLDGERIRAVVGKEPASKSEGQLSALESNFCHDCLLGVLLAVGRQFPDAIYYINYAFMTRFLPYLSPAPMSFVDTHDVLSDKAAKVGAFGVSDNVSISAAEEGAMLQRASAVLAIQRNDAARLATLAPYAPVLTVGVDFAAPDVGPPSDHATILVVAHNNPLNVKGIQDFLRLAWPTIRAARGDARFVVVGTVAQSIRYPDPRVHFAGVVEDLGSYYRRARVVINPSVAGTGLKIKTVESIAYFRPIVTFPNGADGVGQPLLKICHVASDWYQFAEKVLAVLDAPNDALGLDERETIKTSLEPNAVYQELDGWLTGMDQAAAV